MLKQTYKKIEIDTILVNELDLFAQTSSETLYNQTHVPTVKNYQRKIKRNVYNQDLALKGIINNYVTRVVKEYNQEYNTNIKLNKLEKIELAKLILQHVENDINDNIRNERVNN